MLDTLFPIFCISCGKNKSWICDKCFEKITLKNKHTCPFCEKAITPSGRKCFRCLKKSSLDALLIASSYKNTVLLPAIHYYKYRFIENLSHSLGKVMAKAFLASELPLPDIVIPVPLHPRRLRWRGFNQSSILAKILVREIAPGFNLPIQDKLLLRKRFTSPQMKIKNYSQRKTNMQDAFGVNKEFRKNLKGKKILLVDDIATTGATLFECAKILKKGGAKKVFGIVLARQEMK